MEILHFFSLSPISPIKKELMDILKRKNKTRSVTLSSGHLSIFFRCVCVCVVVSVYVYMTVCL